jgi:hypothetical protein
MEIIREDCNFGIPQEPTVISKLAVHFMEDIIPSGNPYSRWDASSETTKYEIKSRRNTHDKYPTTIIPVDKTTVAGRLVFVFNFTDGLYYIVFNQQQFSRYEIRDISAIRGNGVRTLKPHFLIDINDLIQINL